MGGQEQRRHSWGQCSGSCEGSLPAVYMRSPPCGPSSLGIPSATACWCPIARFPGACRYEQGWPPRVRRFAPYVLAKVVFNALILNYAASAFIVSAPRCPTLLHPEATAACPSAASPWLTAVCLVWLHDCLGSWHCRCKRAPANCPPCPACKHAVASPFPPACPQVLWLSDCLAIWRSVYYCGHLAILAIIAVGVLLPPRKPKRDVQPEKAVGKIDGVEAAPGVPAVPVGAPVAPVAAIDEGKKEH